MLSVYKIYKVTEDHDDMKAGDYFSKVLFRNSPHDGAVRSLKSCGKILASGGYDGTVALFDFITLKNVGTLNQHEDSIDGIDFFQNKYMATASADKTICLWRMNDWSLVKQFKGHTGPVTSLAIANCGKFMLSAGKDRVVRMWDLMRAHNANIMRPTINTERGQFNIQPSQILFTDSDLKFAIVHTCYVTIYDGPTEKQEDPFSTPSPIMHVCIDGKDLWAACVSGQIFGWNYETREFYGEYKITDKRIKYIKVEKGYITVLTSEGDAIFGVVSPEHDIDTILSWNVDSRITCGDFHLFEEKKEKAPKGQ
jgi:protein MAK11